MIRHRQGGMGATGWLLTLVVLFGAASIAIRLGPHYLEYRTLVSVVEGLLDEPDLGVTPERELRRNLERRATVNNVRGLDLDEVVALDKSREVVRVAVDYEVREDLFGNVDVVLTFRRDFEQVLR